MHCQKYLKSIHFLKSTHIFCCKALKKIIRATVKNFKVCLFSYVKQFKLLVIKKAFL